VMLEARLQIVLNVKTCGGPMKHLLHALYSSQETATNTKFHECYSHRRYGVPEVPQRV
jgi:hypothetical protein